MTLSKCNVTLADSYAAFTTGDRLRRDVAQIEKRLLQANAILGDPGHIEQIVEQARHLADLPLDDIACFAIALRFVRPSRPRTCVAFRIAPRGLRSSCDSMARN